MRSWSFLTNDALVLINVIEHPRSTLRRIADEVGISDRAALSILRALEQDAIVTRRREGRRNVYTVDLQALRRHRGQGPYTLEELSNALIMLSGRPPGESLPPALRQGPDPPAAPATESKKATARERASKAAPGRPRKPNPAGGTRSRPRVRRAK